MTPENTTKATIWDMDGVIADTAICHFRAWQEAFGKYGIDYPEETFRRYFGRRNVDIIRTVMGPDTPEETVNAISDEKEAKLSRWSTQQLALVSNLISSARAPD